MFFVTGEIWRDLAGSGLGYALGLVLAIAVGIPLGLAAGWYRRLSYAVEPFLRRSMPRRRWRSCR